MQIESVDESYRREPGVRRELDAAHVGRAIARRRSWVILPVLACFVVSAIAVNIVKPRYTAEAKILIENGESSFTRADRADRTDTAPLPDDEAVQSQVQLVTSRDIARDAIKTLDLQGDPEFDPVASGLGPLNRVLVLLGLQRDPLRATAEDRMLSAYYDRLNVYPIVKSRVLSVQFTATDPDLAARAANTIADRYIALQSDAKRDSARVAATSLASLIADLKVRVAAAETKVEEYRAQNGLLVGANNTPIAAQQLADLATQLAQARTAEADAQAKAKVLREMIKANRVADVPDVANSDLIRRISEQRVTLKAQIAQQAMTLLPGHPRMKELNAQLADIDSQLRLAGEKTARQLENDSHIAAGRVDNIKAALDASKQTASTAGNDEVALRSLEQQARLLKEQLDFNTQKYQDAVAREASVSTPADARVVSRAIAPELPSFPKKLPTIAIVTFAGLLLSIGLIVARELLSGRAFIEDAETVAAPRPVVEAPVLAPAPARAVPAPAPAPAAEAVVPEEPRRTSHDIEGLLTVVRAHTGGTGAQRLLVTGADDALPLIPSTLRLARALAGEGRVILVDCGSASDGLAALVGLGDEFATQGLSELLAGDATFADVIHRDAASRLHIIPPGRDGERDDENFAILMDALTHTYDRIVLAVPVPATGETMSGIDRCDLAVLLLSARHATAEIDACRAALYAAGAPAVYALDVEEGVAAAPSQAAA